MRPPPVTSMAIHPPLFPLLLVTLLANSPSTVDGCFNKIEILSSTPVWLQPSRVYSYVRYFVDGTHRDRIHVYEYEYGTRARPPKHVVDIKCLFATSNTAKVQLVAKGKDVKAEEFRCLRFESLTANVLRMSSASIQTPVDEVDCDTFEYQIRPRVLINEDQVPAQPCPFLRSYQADLEASSRDECHASIQPVSKDNRVIFTFESSCKLPDFGFYNEGNIQGQLVLHLTCLVSWENIESNTTSVVLRNNQDHSNFWCLTYKMEQRNGESLDAIIDFEGKCNFRTMKEFDIYHTENSFRGSFQSFVSSHDKRCRDKSIMISCMKRRDVLCSQTNTCPSACKRCYGIPKIGPCNFKSEHLGRWRTVNSSVDLSVDFDTKSLTTSTYGKFRCLDGDTTNRYIQPVVQHTHNHAMVPFHGCAQTYHLAPGVMTFYFRPSVLSTNSVNPLSCEKTVESFKIFPHQEGKMVTLVNEEHLKKTRCDFGPSVQFPTNSDSCQLNVDECTGQCDTLSVSYDNDTCQAEHTMLPIATNHTCLARLKFKDGVGGMLTYSEELQKYSCWIFFSRLFVADPSLCNYEMVNDIFGDVEAMRKYDPLKAFTVRPLLSPSLGNTLQSRFPFWCLVVVGALIPLTLQASGLCK